MALYVVSYDLHKVRDYGPLIQALQGAGAIRALESFWLIDIAQTAAGLRDALRALVDDDDSLVVLELKPGSGWATRLPRPGTVEWLRAHVVP